MADIDKALPNTKTTIEVPGQTEIDQALNEDILELIDLASENKSDALVIKMKQIVPEFISLNSKFEKFDN